MKPPLETVHSINRYYDGAELGVADFQGRRHVYERITERHDGKPPTYRLSPIDQESLAAVLEDWKLWSRWNTETWGDASRNILDDSPRVMPDDLPRYFELRPLVEIALQIDEDKAQKAKGTFLNADGVMKVRWQPV